jgi:hypothetical protein
MINLLKVGLTVLIVFSLAGCAALSGAPVEIPVDIAIAGSTGDVNTSITSSVHNIVSQLEAWQMGVIVGLAWLVGWLSPGPMEMIRGFFSGLSLVLTGFARVFK